MPAEPRPIARRELAVAALLLGLAFLLRVVVALKIAPDISFGDQDEYLAGAERLLAGQPLAAKNLMYFVRAPGYSTFLAAVFWLTGSRSFGAVKVVQALFATGTCFYVWRMARLFGGSVLAGLLALGAAAFYPYFVFQSAALGTEGLFAFFVAAGTYHLARGLSGETLSVRHLVAASSLMALGNLIRPNLSTLLPLVALWIVWRWRHQWRAIVRIGLALALPLFLLTLPWTLAVHRQGFGWMWVSDGAGIWYFRGHNDDALKLYYCEPASPAELARLRTAMDFSDPAYHEAATLPQAEQQRAFWRAALDWDQQHARKLPCLMLHKTLAFWRPWVNPDAYGRAQVLLSLFSLPVLLGGAIGLWLARRQGERILTTIILCNAAAATLVAMLFSTEIRYRVPVVDVLFLPAMGLALAEVYSRAMRMRR
jgi:hypothetical protein